MHFLRLLTDPPEVGVPVPFSNLDVVRIPFFGSGIHAGFPSPADDYTEACLDLNELVMRHPAATFFIRVQGNSMINAGIHDGDILVVDRALPPKNNTIIVAALQGEFAVKRLRKSRDILILLAENPEYEPIEVTPEMDFEVWGVVTYAFHPVK